jgi:hypothetical protein
MCAKIISIEQAIEMKNEYKTHIKPLIDNYRGSGYKATEFAWIDMGTLKDYIKKLDEVKAKNGKDVSGIRIYFSAYPNSASLNSGGGATMYPARETVFMVPTIEVESAADSISYPNLQNVPFCIKPDNVTEPLKGSIEIITDLLNSNDCTTGTCTTSYTNKTSLVMDEMGLTPPPA